MVFFVAFTGVFLTTMNPSVSHGVVKSVYHDMTKNVFYSWSSQVPYVEMHGPHKELADISNVPDLYSWLTMGLVPRLWSGAEDWGELRANMYSECLRQERLRDFGLVDSATSACTGPAAAER